MRIITILLITLPLLGQTGWERFYGGNGEDASFAIDRAPDGFIIAGHTTSSGNGGFDYYIVRINNNGDTIWTKTAGGNNDDFARCIISTDDGNFIVSGLTYSYGAGNSDVYIAKLNSQGDTLWTRTYGGAIADEMYGIVESGGKYLLAGRTYSYGAGNFDIYVIAIDENGDSLWSHTYGGNITDGANSIIPAGNGFLIVGYTYSFGHGNYDVYVVKIDSAGNLIWQRTYGGSDDDVGTSAVLCDDGGFIIGGYTYTFTNGSDDIFLVRVDSSGNVIWQRHYGGAGLDEVFSLQKSGNLVFGAGVTESYGSGRKDAFVFAINENGDMIWNETFGYSGNDGAYDMVTAGDGNFVIAGYSNRYGTYDAYVVKFNPGVAIQENGFKERSMTLLQNRLELNIRESGNMKISLFDASGRLISQIFDGFLTPGEYSFDIPIKKSGVYLVEVETGTERRVLKGIFIR